MKQKARREKRSAGEVLSGLARRALANDAAASAVTEEESFYGFHLLPRRGPAVSNELIDRLRDDKPD